MPVTPADPQARAEVLVSIVIGALLLLFAFLYPSAVDNVLRRASLTETTEYVIQFVPVAVFGLAVVLRARAAWRAAVAVGLLAVQYAVIIEPFWAAMHGHYQANPRPISYLLWIVSATFTVGAWGICRRSGWAWLIGLLAAWPISWLDSKLITTAVQPHVGFGPWAFGALSVLTTLGILAGIFVCYLVELVFDPDPVAVPASPQPTAESPAGR